MAKSSPTPPKFLSAEPLWKGGIHPAYLFRQGTGKRDHQAVGECERIFAPFRDQGRQEGDAEVHPARELPEKPIRAEDPHP